MSKPKYSASSLASDVRPLVTKACGFITREYLEIKYIFQWQKTPKTNRTPKTHKIAIINMLTKDRRAIHVQSKNFNREIENIKITKREMVELENVINKLKN